MESRLQILKAQTRKFALSPDVDLMEVAKALPRNVTGADISGVTGSAFSCALERKISQLTQEALLKAASDTATSDVGSNVRSSDEYVIKSYINNLSDDCIAVQISREDFAKAVLEMTPSLIDLNYYESLNRLYSDS